MGRFWLFAYTGLTDRFRHARGFFLQVKKVFSRSSDQKKTTCWFWKTFHTMKNKSNFQNKYVGSALGTWTKK